LAVEDLTENNFQQQLRPKDKLLIVKEMPSGEIETLPWVVSFLCWD